MKRAVRPIAICLGFAVAGLGIWFAPRGRADAQYRRGAEKVYAAVQAVAEDLRETHAADDGRLYRAQMTELSWHQGLGPAGRQRASARALHEALSSFSLAAGCRAVANQRGMALQQQQLLKQASQEQAEGEAAMKRARQHLDKGE